MSIFYLHQRAIRTLVLSSLFILFGLDVQAQSFNIDDHDGTIVRTCEGLFYDSGGGARSYRSGENYAVTFCPEQGTTGKLVRLFFLEVDIRGIASVDKICFFDGNSVNSPSLGCINEALDQGENYEVSASDDSPTGCLTVTFVSGFLPTSRDGWQARIVCIDKCPKIESRLVMSEPAIDANGFINVCPNQEISFFGAAEFPTDFDRADAAEFSWYFGDDKKADVIDARHSYEESGGYKVQLSVVDPMTGCTNLNDIDVRVRVSPKPNFELASELTQPVCAGDTVSLSAAVDDGLSAASILVKPDTSAFLPSIVRSDSLALPDGEGNAYESTIFFDNFAANSTFQDSSDLISVCVNMEHSWARDLKISLRCPTGKEVILHNFWGQTGNRIRIGTPNEGDNTVPVPGVGANYCWTPLATNGTWIEYSDVNSPTSPLNLPSGDYLPYQNFNEFVGCPLNGQWTIEVEDLWAVDNGYIFNWQLNFDTQLYAETDPFSPTITAFEWEMQDNLIYHSQDSIASVPVNAGGNVYNFQITDEYGCVFDTLATVPILPITHPDCYNCLDYERPFTLIPDTTICNGDVLELGEGQTVLYDTIRFVNMQIYDDLGHDNHPPTNPYESIIDINNMFPEAIVDPTTEIAQICLTLQASEAEFISDYDIALQAPSGEMLQLVQFQLFVDVGNELLQTCFTPSATTRVDNGTPPFTGEFAPMGDWADLTGAMKNGAWKLVLADRVMGRQLTTLKDWSITFVSENSISYSWTASSELSCDDCPSPSVTPPASDAFILRTRDNFNCNYRDTINVVNIGDFEAPELICTVLEDDELLRIDWTPQAGIDDYEISINGSDFEIPNFNFFSHNVAGLDINEEITVAVRAALENVPENLNCDIPTTETTCIYNACAFKVSFTDPPSAVSCPGDSDGTASVEVSEGIAPFAFVLDGVEIQNSNLTTASFEGLAVGEHQLVVADGDACFDTLMFMIEEPLPIDIAPIVTNVSCNAGEDAMIDLTTTGGTGAYTYAWSDASSDSLLTNITADTYSVTITDENNCQSSLEIEVTEPDMLVIDLSSTTASCFNTTDGTATAIVSGGTGAYTYAWSNSETSDIITDLIPATYTLSVTDENNCLTTGEIEVTAPDAVVIDSIQQIAVDCNGSSTGTAIVRISGGTEPYVYQWSDDLGQTSESAQFLTAGMYSVTVTDANNCSNEASIEVTEPEAITVAFDASNVNCNAGEDGTAMAMPSGGIEPYEYLWNDPKAQSTQTAVELGAGTYSVVVTDANNCTLESEVLITEPETALAATITQTFTSCYGEANSQSTVEASGGTGEYTYLWSDGQIKDTATNLDTLSYEVTITDENGCAFTSSIVIDDFEPFDININASTPSCSGDSDGALGATVIVGGTGDDYEYAWDTEPAQSGFFIEGIAGGRTYTLTVTDSQGCEGIESFPLPDPNPVTLELASSDVLCTDGSTGAVSVVNVTGGNPFEGYSIQWGENAASSTQDSVTNLPIGTYSVTATDVAGCFGVAEITIAQPNSLATSFDVINNGCNNAVAGEITAVVSGGVGDYDLNWSTGSNENTITGLSSGTYTLTITDANGCELVSTAMVEQPSFIDAQATIASSIQCAGNNDGRIALAPIGGTPPYEYSLDGEDYSSSSQFIGLGAGFYDIFIRDANGCVQNTTVELQDPPPFSVFISPREDVVEIATGDSLRIFVNSINATGIVDWEWTPSFGEGSISCTTCSDPVIRPETTIYYELYGIDENGCEATDQIQIRVRRDERVLLVPTGFSPNDDGENDVLLVHSKETALVRYFRLYDRWGELLYEMTDFPANDDTIGWDGMFRNKEMPTGSYIWTAEVEYADGMIEVFRGSTTLIR